MPNLLLENDLAFSTGQGVVPWHGIGTKMNKVSTTEEAIKRAKLDWLVEQRPIYTTRNCVSPIPSYFANVRSDNQSVLGIVSERYHVVQNKEMFDFADDLTGNSKMRCSLETAGILYGGKRVFMLLKMPKGRLIEDDYTPYICISNSFDGSTCLQIFLTAIRIVCTNAISAAFKSATRKIAIRHSSGLEQRKEDALKTMGTASRYFKDLEKFASNLAGTKVNIDKVLDSLYPKIADMTKRQIEANIDTKESIKSLMKNKDDLQNFRNGNAWGAYSAIADYRSNAEPKRKTATFADSKMARFIDGDPVLQRAQEIILEMAA
jgi:phage/plasmid-like protein (TIGR03299 family)